MVESSPMDLQLRLLGYDNDIEAILFMKIVSCKVSPTDSSSKHTDIALQASSLGNGWPFLFT